MGEPAEILSEFDVETEIAQALAICDGDPMAALRATLIANAFLEAEIAKRVADMSAAGNARGRVKKPDKRVRTKIELPPS